MASFSAQANGMLSCRVEVSGQAQKIVRKMDIYRSGGMFKNDGVNFSTMILDLENGSRARIDVAALYRPKTVSRITIRISEERLNTILGTQSFERAKIESKVKNACLPVEADFGRQRVKVHCTVNQSANQMLGRKTAI